MNTELVPTSTAVIDRGAGTAVQHLQERARVIMEVMTNVLEKEKDYGVIPGTDKPTLYKPGAEKLLLTFNLAAGKPAVDDLSTDDEIRYRVGVPIESPDGRVRWGIGEASSNEEKYRWRKPVCDQEWDDTPPHLRREKWFKGQWVKGHNNPPYKGKQIRTSPADVANTILKMAHKRGFIHSTLIATGASSVFNQDLEDFTKEMQEAILDMDPTATAPLPKAAQRVSAAAAGGKPKQANGGEAGMVTDARTVKDVRVFGKDKDNNAISLNGDPNEYTTKDAAVAAEIAAFKSTDHLIRIRYEDNDWQGRTFHNLKSFSLADDAAQTRPASGDIEPVTAPAGERGIIVDVIERPQGSLIKLQGGFQCATADAELIAAAKDSKAAGRRVELITTAPRDPKYARRLVEINIVTDEPTQ